MKTVVYPKVVRVGITSYTREFLFEFNFTCSETLEEVVDRFGNPNGKYVVVQLNLNRLKADMWPNKVGNVITNLSEPVVIDNVSNAITNDLSKMYSSPSFDSTSTNVVNIDTAINSNDIVQADNDILNEVFGNDCIVSKDTLDTDLVHELLHRVERLEKDNRELKYQISKFAKGQVPEDFSSSILESLFEE